MPQITLYITKAMDEAWRDATPTEKDRVTTALRSVIRRRLGVKAEKKPKGRSRGSQGQGKT